MGHIYSGMGVCVHTDTKGNISRVFKVKGVLVPWGTVAEIRQQLCHLPEMRSELEKLKDFRVMPDRQYQELIKREIANRVGAYGELPVITPELWDRLYARHRVLYEAKSVAVDMYQESGDSSVFAATSPKIHPNDDPEYKIAKEFGFPSYTHLLWSITPEQGEALIKLGDEIFRNGEEA